jgi:hypothetical protein
MAVPSRSSAAGMARQDIHMHGTAHGVLRRPDSTDILVAHGPDGIAGER